MNTADQPMTSTTAPEEDALLPVKKVTAACGFSKTSIYRMMERGTFPRPAKRHGRSVRWSRSEVQAWMRDEWKPAM